MFASMRSLLCAMGGLIALGSATGRGATLTVDVETIPGLTAKSSIVTRTIRLTGMIEEGDADGLRKILDRLKSAELRTPGRPLATIELSSNGGSVYEGVKIGYLLREFDVASVVRARDSCLSACALAFLGGTSSHSGPNVNPSRSIERGGQVGFHNFVLNPDSLQLGPVKDPREALLKGFSEARGGASVLLRYASSIGVDASFLARQLGRPPDQMEYIDTAGQFVMLQVCPLSLDRPQASRAQIAANICNHSTGWLDPAASPQARPLSSSDIKRRLLEQVRQNIGAMSLKGPMATQLAAVLESHDKQLLDAVYGDLRSAGIPLLELFGPTFQVSGYAFGDYRVQCDVSFSRDDPNKFDVVLEGPNGLMEPVQKPPRSCPGLFLYDKDDMLNPQR